MNDDTLLHRHVNPSWVQQGRVTSQAFRPTPKDKSKLSAYDGDQINPEDSWAHFTTELGFTSIGVMAITVEECSNQQLPAVPDPTPFPEHVLIDFTGFAENQIRQKSKRLQVQAEARGWLYQSE